VPLTVNYKDIPFWQDKFLLDDPDNPGRKVESPWVFVIGMFSLHVGIGKITRDNAAEFYARCKLVEACTGALMTSPDGDVPVTPDVVERFIGVTTNASPYTPAAFYRHLRDDLMPSLTYRYSQAIAALESERKEAVMDSLGMSSDKAAASD
jgi:hypothetical protein